MLVHMGFTYPDNVSSYIVVMGENSTFLNHLPFLFSAKKYHPLLANQLRSLCLYLLLLGLLTLLEKICPSLPFTVMELSKHSLLMASQSSLLCCSLKR